MKKHKLFEFFDSGNARKLTVDDDIVQASIAAELDAISLYRTYAEITDDEKLKTVLLDVAKEEEEHVGEFLKTLEEIRPDIVDNINAGKEEVKELTESLRNDLKDLFISPTMKIVLKEILKDLLKGFLTTNELKKLLR